MAPSRDWRGDELASAARSGDLKEVRQLLAGGVDTNACCGGDPALFNCGSVEVAQVLVQNGADVRARNDRGSCVLHFLAARSGNLTSLMNFFLEQGVDINDKRLDGWGTPLDSAYIANFRQGNPVAIAFLASKGGRCVNAENRNRPEYAP